MKVCLLFELFLAKQSGYASRNFKRFCKKTFSFNSAGRLRIGGWTDNNVESKFFVLLLINLVFYFNLQYTFVETEFNS